MTHQTTGPLTLALIGAGRAGRSLAAAAVLAGHHVVLEDVLPSKLREALDEIPVDGLSGTLQTVTTVEDAVRNADLVIDYVPDELESKLEIVCMVDRMAPPRSVLCIQTSALSVSDLAACTYRADQVAGVQIVDNTATITTGDRTSVETSSLSRQFFESLGFTVETVPEFQRAYDR